MKQLSKAATAGLKLIYRQIGNYNFETQYYSGVKTFWPVQSNQYFIDAINKWNSRNKFISISTFDSSTLYTNIQHHKLKSVIGELVSFCFNGGDKKSLGSLDIGTFGTNSQDNQLLTKQSLFYLL